MRLLRTANEQAKTQWEAEHRPWVGSGEFVVQQPVFLVYPNNPIQGRVQFSFTVEAPIKNFGVSPALHVETMLMGAITEQIAAPPTMDSMMVSACQWADNNSNVVGGIVFPNAETRFEESANLMAPIDQINKVRRVYLAICTAYSGANDRTIHHTKIWLACWPINGQPPEINRSIKPTIIYYSLPITRWGIVRTEAD